MKKEIIDIRTETLCVITYLAASGNPTVAPELRVLLTDAETGKHRLDIGLAWTSFPTPDLHKREPEEDFVRVPRDLFEEVSQVLELGIQLEPDTDAGYRRFKTLAGLSRCLREEDPHV